MALLDTALDNGPDDSGDEGNSSSLAPQQDSQDKAMSNPDYRSLIFKSLGIKDPQAQQPSNQASQLSEINSPTSNRGSQSPPRQQITNLKQLGQAAKNLQNLPDDIKRRVLSHLLGIPWEDPKDTALSNSLTTALYKNQLGAPDRQAAEARRQESLKNRETQQTLLMKLRQRQAKQQEAYRGEALKAHRESARNQLANSISNLTRALEMTTDPNQKNELAKMLLKQHKAYQSFADYEGNLDEKQQQQQEESQQPQQQVVGEGNSQEY